VIAASLVQDRCAVSLAPRSAMSVRGVTASGHPYLLDCVPYRDSGLGCGTGMIQAYLVHGFVCTSSLRCCLRCAAAERCGASWSELSEIAVFSVASCSRYNRGCAGPYVGAAGSCVQGNQPAACRCDVMIQYILQIHAVCWSPYIHPCHRSPGYNSSAIHHRVNASISKLQPNSGGICLISTTRPHIASPGSRATRV